MNLTTAQQVEQLDFLFNTDCWKKYLVPTFNQAVEVTIANIKSTRDPNALNYYAGILTGLDALLRLPDLRDFLAAGPAEGEQPAQSVEQV